MTKMAAMLIYGKNLLLWNQWADCLETLYVAFGNLVLQILINDDPELTLTYFMARSNVVSKALNRKS